MPTSEEHWERHAPHIEYDPVFPRTGGLCGATTAGGGQPADPDADETDGPRPAPGDEAEDGKTQSGETAQGQTEGQTDGDGDDDPEDVD
jgi:hypothetical protein